MSDAPIDEACHCEFYEQTPQGPMCKVCGAYFSPDWAITESNCGKFTLIKPIPGQVVCEVDLPQYAALIRHAPQMYEMLKFYSKRGMLDMDKVIAIPAMIKEIEECLTQSRPE